MQFRKLSFSKFLVHFEWDDGLEGRIGYLANIAADLREFVQGQSSSDRGSVGVGRVHRSSKRGHPFRLGDTCMTYRFFYPCTFAPYWDAYQVGATILYHTGDSDWKVIPPGTIITDHSYWSGDYVYHICHESLGGSSDVSPHCSSDGSTDVTANCTWGQLAEWLASGYGLVRFPDMTVGQTVSFKCEDIDRPVSPGVHIRPFGGLLWVEPLSHIVGDYLEDA